VGMMLFKRNQLEKQVNFDMIAQKYGGGNGLVVRL
jgi:hypothetical protein